MKSVVIDHPGDPSVLKIVDRPIPQADLQHSVIKIHAFSVHRYEALTRAGGSPDVHFPRVIGVEAVGQVYATDPKSGLKVGQKVVTLMGGLGREFDGSYQAYALIPNSQLYPVAFSGSWTQLAVYPETFYTALGAIQTLRLKEGQSILVRGATSTVGLAIIELGKSLGLSVYGTTRQQERLAWLEKFGVVQSFLDQEKQLKTTSRFDGIIDLVGTATCADSLTHLKVHGTCCLVGLLAGEWTIENFDPFMSLGQKYLTVFDSTKVDAQLIQTVFNLIKEHNLTIPIAKTFSLDEIVEAQIYATQPHTIGQVVVTVGEKDW